MTLRLQLEALAVALESWGDNEVWGTAHDAEHSALVHGAVRNHVLIVDEAVVLERHVGPVHESVKAGL